MDLDKHPQKPVAPADARRAAIRASDADRDRIADILRDALAEGRLDAEEHSERIDAVYRAKTVGELEPLVRDLPAARTAPGDATRVRVRRPSAPAGPAENLVAVFSSSTRKGRWRVGRRTNAFALFGSVEIDLTEALFEQRLTVINATVHLRQCRGPGPGEHLAARQRHRLLRQLRGRSRLEAADPEAPVVVVNGSRSSAMSRPSPSGAS